MKKVTLLLLSFVSFFTSAQDVLMTPDAFLGYPLGSQFTRHHQVMDYFEYIAKNSPLVKTESYGTTYEGRKLLLAYLTSENNMGQLEQLRQKHLQSIGALEGETDQEKDFGVVWLSYNVHGNESASTEAAMKTLHTLATEKKQWLDKLIIVMDPCINPDGRDRYVNWYNQVKSTPFDPKPFANEHYEEWPRGRYNHYLFDLNRDWAWSSQKETQQRIPYYQKWMPQIHVDFHEQGVNSPYYFAPAAEPFHELITDFQREFQHSIGKNHAKYFDKEGWLYFTKEVFDLLYPGYGDTYPMFHGAIGMTYEQGGSGRAGLSIKNEVGDYLSLTDRLIHHYTTGLSTVESAYNNLDALNQNFSRYHKGHDAKYTTYALRGKKDHINALGALLEQHNISFEHPVKTTTLKGFSYGTQKNSSLRFDTNSLIIKGNKARSRFIETLFEPQTQYGDSLTYDITSWSLPYAYGLEGVASSQNIETVKPEGPLKKNTFNKNSYAFASEWKSLEDGKYLAALLKENIRVNYTTVPLTNGGKNWDMGSLFVLKGENKHIQNLGAKLEQIAEIHKQEVIGLASGFSEKGIDLGSNKMEFISPKKIGLLKSDAASPQGYGELWHFMEQQLHYPVTQIDLDRLSGDILNQFDVLLLPPGYYASLWKTTENNALLQWIKKGGRLIALGSALYAFADQNPFGLKQKTSQRESATTDAYADQERIAIQSAIYGSIYKAEVDETHPLASGYDAHYFTLKNSATAYELLEESFNYARLADNAKPFAGFSGSQAIEQQSNSLLFGEENIGRGSVVYFVDNPMYRSFWYNGKLWLVNALFF